MNPIIAPIKAGDSGRRVTNLQDALIFLVERKIIRALSPPDRPTAMELEELTQRVTDERAQSLFREATRALIQYFQIQQSLGDNLFGTVEDKTAAALNEILKSFGAPEPTHSEIGTDEQACRTCRFYEFYDDRAQDEHGSCVRNAPHPRLTKDENPNELFYADWPLVRWNAWCGEWQRDPKLDEPDDL